MAIDSGVDYAEKSIGRNGVIPIGRTVYDDKSYNPILGHAPAINVGNISTGADRFTKNMGDVSDMSQEEYTDALYNQQSAWGRMGNALVNNVVIAGTTAVGGVLGLADGLLEAAASGDASKIWDNEVNNLMVRWQNHMQEYLPILRDSQYENSSLLSKMGSSVFWADLIQNLGFTEGMVVPGMLTGGLLSSAPKLVQHVVPSLVSAIGEASVEAVNNKNDELDSKHEMLSNTFKQMYEKASTPEEKSNVLNDYYKALEDIDEDAKRSGNFVFGSNIALLTMTNSIEFGKLFSRGYETGRRLNNALSGTLEKGVEGTTKGIEIAKGIGRGVANSSSEAFEEISQDFITKVPMYYSPYDTFNESKFNLDKRYEVSNIWKSCVEAYYDIMNDPNTLTDGAMGFITGAIGMPTLVNSRGEFKPSIQGGIAGEVKSHIEEANKSARIAEQINARIQNDKYMKNMYDGIVRHLAIQDEANTHLDNNNVKGYQDSMSKQLLSDIIMFDNAGRLDILKEIYGNNFDMSDENIQKIIDESPKEDGNGPFTDNGNNKSIEEVREILKKKSEFLNNAIDEYSKDKEKLEANYPYLSEDSMQSALFLLHQNRDWSNRLKTLNQESFDEFKNIVENHKPVRVKVNDKDNTIKFTLNNVDHVVNREDYESYLKTEEDRTYLDFSRMLSSSSNFILNFFDDKTFRTLALETMLDKNKVPEDSRMNTINKLKDIKDITESITRYVEDYNKLVSDPKNSNVKEEKRKAKATVEYEMVKRNMKKDAFSRVSTYGEVESLFDDSQTFVPSEDESAIMGESSSPVSQTYKQSKDFLDVFNALVDQATSENNATLSKSDAALLKKAFKEKFNNSSSLDEVKDSSFSYQFEEGDPVFLNDRLIYFTALTENEIKKRDYSKINPSVEGPSTPETSGGKDGVGGTPIPSSSSQQTTSFTSLINTRLEATEVHEVADMFRDILGDLSVLENDFNKNKTLDNAKKIEEKLNLLVSMMESFSSIANAQDESAYVDFLREVQKFADYVHPGLKFLSREADLKAADEDLGSGNQERGENKNFYLTTVPEYDTASRLPQKNDNKDTFVPKFIPFKDKNPSYTAVYDYLNDPATSGTGISAYEYVNRGFLKVGDTVSLHSVHIGDYDCVIMKRGEQVVGILPSAKSGYPSIKAVHKAAKAGTPMTITVDKIMLGQYAYTRDHTRSLSDVEGIDLDNVEFGVFAPVQDGDLSVSTNLNDEDQIDKVGNVENAIGGLYLILPNSQSRKTPKRVIIAHFNKNEFDLEKLKDTDNSRAKALHSIIESMANAKDEDLFNAAFLKLKDILVLPSDLHVNYKIGNNGSRFISFKGNTRNSPYNATVNIGRIKGKNIQSAGGDLVFYSQDNADFERRPTEEIYNELLERLYSINPQFTVNVNSPSIKYLDGNRINSGDYNKQLIKDGIVSTHLTTVRMRNSWFATTVLDDDLKEQKASSPEGKRPVETSKGMRVEYNGTEYYVKDGKIYDSKQNLLDLVDFTKNDLDVAKATDTMELIKDVADVYKMYGNATNGVSMYRGKVKINGRYLYVGKDKSGKSVIRRLSEDEIKALNKQLEEKSEASRNAREAFERLKADQRRIRRKADGRPDNENGYWVQSPSGEYVQYQRVHGYLPSQYNGEPSERASHALAKGQTVDGILRDFFTGIRKTSDFNDENSIEVKKMLQQWNITYSSLRALLDKVDAVLERVKNSNSHILCELDGNSIVLFGEDKNGNRVAGEVDALIYNEDNGTFDIIDFKTSGNNFEYEHNGIIEFDSSYKNAQKGQNFSSLEAHTSQQNAYRNLFEGMYGVPVSSMSIMPFVLQYKESGPITRITPQTEFTLARKTVIDVAPFKVSTPVSQVPTSTPVSPSITGKQKLNVVNLKDLSAPSRVIEGEVYDFGTFHGQHIYCGLHQQPSDKNRRIYNVYIVFPNSVSILALGGVVDLGSINEPIDFNTLNEKLDAVGKKLNSTWNAEKMKQFANLFDSKQSLDISQIVAATNTQSSGTIPASPESLPAESKSLDSDSQNSSWNSLSESTKEMLSIVGYNEDSWNSLSEEEQDSAISCI